MATVEVQMDIADQTVSVGQAHVTRQRGQISTMFLDEPEFFARMD